MFFDALSNHNIILYKQSSIIQMYTVLRTFIFYISTTIKKTITANEVALSKALLLDVRALGNGAGDNSCGFSPTARLTKSSDYQ